MHNLFFHLLDFGSLLTTYIYRQVSDSSTCQLSYPTISHTAATIVGLEEKGPSLHSQISYPFPPLGGSPFFCANVPKRTGLAVVLLVNDQYIDRPPYSIFVYALSTCLTRPNISNQGRSMCLHIPRKSLIIITQLNLLAFVKG